MFQRDWGESLLGFEAGGIISWLPQFLSATLGVMDFKQMGVGLAARPEAMAAPTKRACGLVAPRPRA